MAPRTAALGLVVAAAWPSPALADAPPPAPQPFVRHFVFGQALGVLIHRLSLGYELLRGAHHSFGITVHGHWPSTEILTVANGAVAGFGGELGYRYYAGEHGPTGPFFGVALIGGDYHSRTSFFKPNDPTARWYGQYGWALDLGWGTVVDKTINVIFALGVQRTAIGVDVASISGDAQLYVGEGMRPRAMLQIGRVF